MRQLLGSPEQLQLPEALLYPRRSLVLIGGPIGAGKSTLTRRLFPDSEILDPDLLIDSGQASHIGEALRLTAGSLRRRLAAGKAPLIANATMTAHFGDHLIKLAAKHGYQAHVIAIDATLDQCLETWARDGRDFSDSVVEQVYVEWKLRLIELMDPTDPQRAQIDSLLVVDRRQATALQTVQFRP